VDIVFSDHAEFQLKKRRISKELVKKAVLNPQSIEPSFRGRNLLRSMIGDKLLEVVIKTEGSVVIVITGYYLN